MDPRRYDLVVRSTVTALIALVVIAVVAIQALRNEPLNENLVGWGGIIVGVFIGSHASLNGGGVRAARDQELTETLLNSTPPAPPPVVPPVVVVQGSDK